MEYCSNPKASFDYEILETIEGGLVLKGIEVKSNWTISKHVNNVQLKKQSAMQKLTSYEIWVMNNKGAIEKVL